MAEGKCTKDYPKQFKSQTVLTENGYPQYKRTDNGRTVKVGSADRQREIDNRWIVPYNPFLTKKYNAHINLEACTSIKSVKYLFKYIYKGHDCANLQMTASNTIDHDEVTHFLDARYLSAPEAFWRLSEFHLHMHSHAVKRLPVHLPNMQSIYFDTGTEQAATEKAADEHTMLTAFFEYNSLHHTDYCYHEFPNHFIWQSNEKKWKPRKQRGATVVTRMYQVTAYVYYCSTHQGHATSKNY
jgi:hypothetical protein